MTSVVCLFPFIVNSLAAGDFFDNLEVACSTIKIQNLQGKPIK